MKLATAVETTGVDAVLNKISTVTRIDAVLPITEDVKMTVFPTDGELRVGFGPQLEVPELSHAYLPATAWAHRQIAAEAKIPWQYYKRMADDEVALSLLTRNVNHWWHRPGQSPRLARIAMNGEGPKLRAWLSPKYRVLDHEDLVANVLREAEKMTDVEIKEASVDDERMYVRLLTPIEADIGGRATGDIVRLGLSLRNSEVGDGAIAIAPYIERLVCLNGMTVPVKLRQVHLGQRRDIGIVSRETIEKDSAAIWSGVRDWVRFVLDKDRLDEVVQYFQTAQMVEVKTEARVAVGNVVKTYGMKPGDARDVFERYLRNGDDTQFGMVNAVTQAAHEVERPFREQVEMEAVGGKLLVESASSFTRMIGRTMSAKDTARLYGGE